MILEELRERWWRKIVEHNLESEKIVIKVKGLKPENAIGKPSLVDYPLLKGREAMLQAEFKGAYGQAFTDELTDYIGSLLSLYTMSLNTNKDRALLVATINATYRYLGLITNTKHCKDEGPELCGKRIAMELASKLPINSKIAIIGFQPALIYHISREFKNLRVTDMDFDNIGRVKLGILIEPYTLNQKVIAWSDAVIATGSTLVNNTIDNIIEWSKGKKLFFYGVTISAAAYEFNLTRLCFEAG
ncbi:MAG: DUF364 domain-containing protein [Nitrososphaerales archaeon]